MKTRSRNVIVAFVAIASLIVVAPHASAATRTVRKVGPLVYVTRHFRHVKGQDIAELVLCPHGTRVTGGGGSIGGDSEVTSATPFDNDADGQPDDGYEIVGWNNTTDPVPVTVTAICLRDSKGGWGLTYKAESFGNGAGQEGEHADLCDASTPVLVGGGAWLQPTPTASGEQLKWDGPDNSGDGWELVASSAEARTFSLYLSCLPTGAREVHLVEKRIIPSGADADQRAIVRCPHAWHVSSGGFFVNTYVTRSAPTPRHDGWMVRMRNGGLIFAVCMK